jgi:Tol biopolymer transport system component
VPRAQRPPAVVRAAAAFAAAAIAAVCGASSSTGAQDPGRILFASDLAYFKVHAALYTIGVDGRGRRRLLSNVDNTLSAQWSPDGMRIAFFRNGAIRVVPARGGKPRIAARVRDGADTQFSWSPDGTRIAFFDFDVADTLVVVRIGPKMVVSRFATHGGGAEKPTWSPDGNRIAFDRVRGNRTDLTAIDLANGHATVLFPRLAGAGLAWSPDGRTIAYDDSTTVYLADLARHTHRALGPGNTASWSPDGKKLAVNRRLSNVDVIDVRTHRRVHVSGYFSTNGRQSEDPPSWTPDSRSLAVPVRNDVYLVRADGRARKAVTHYGSTFELLTTPSLSPDGRRVVYVAERYVAQDDDLYSIGPDGSALRSITRNSLGEDQPVWSPDRTRIAFVRLTGLSGKCS